MLCVRPFITRSVMTFYDDTDRDPMNPSDNEIENPFESPAESGPVRRRRRRPQRAQALAFIQLAFQFKLLAVAMLLIGLLMLSQILWLGIVLCACGVIFFVTGYGISSYKAWGWYAAVILVVPLLAVTSVLGLLFGFFYGSIFAILSLIFVPLYCYYIGWTLFSRSGRQRFDETVQAVATAKANPDSVAGRLYGRK